MTFILPGDSERLVIVGRTGSGKTVAGAWHLSKRSWDHMPWVACNFKGDELLNAMGATEIDIGRAPPKRAGLYLANILPNEDDKLEAFLQKCWAKGEIGLFVDEGYMLPKASKWYRAIQTQGRSLKVPTITLSQRPVWLDRFVMSEADAYQLFHIHDERDRQTAQSFVPYDLDGAWAASSEFRLPPFHSIYHDVKRYSTMVLKPVPDRDTVLEMFHDRLRAKRRFI